MKLVNLTPHTVAIETPEGRLTLSSEGLARVSMKTTPDSTVEVETIVAIDRRFNGVDYTEPCTQYNTVAFNRPIEYGPVEGLPEPVEGALYIVSMLVAQRAMRSDVVSPDSGPSAIRFKDGPNKGQIEAVRALNRYV
jgi:hypothetical protein